MSILSNKERNAQIDIAYDKFNSGEQPDFSRGVCENVTAGYGVCDVFGYFEFPLIVDQDSLQIIAEEK